MAAPNSANLVDWASVAVALALFLATTAYTYYTKKQLETNSQQLKANSKPFVTADLKYTTPKYLHLIVTNLGNGPAHDVTATWSMDDSPCEDDSAKEWGTNILRPGEVHKFKLPLNDSGVYEEVSDIQARISGDKETIKFEACCTDILGREYDDFEDELNIQKALDRVGDADEYLEPDSLSEIRRIMEEWGNEEDSR